MSMEHFVAIGALVCVAPVLVGFVVTRWSKAWVRSGETIRRAGQ